MGDPYRGSERRPWVNRVLCGVVDRGGILERDRRGVPPIGAVKSEGSAGGGGFSTVGAGISSAYSQWSGLHGLFVSSRGNGGTGGWCNGRLWWRGG